MHLQHIRTCTLVNTGMLTFSSIRISYSAEASLWYDYLVDNSFLLCNCQALVLTLKCGLRQYRHAKNVSVLSNIKYTPLPETLNSMLYLACLHMNNR